MILGACAMPSRLDIELLDKGPLSKAEGRALCQWLTGDTHKECAKRLFISVYTMETHIQRIKDKLQVRNQVVALKKAEDMGMVKSRLVKLGCIVICFLALHDQYAMRTRMPKSRGAGSSLVVARARFETAV